MKTFYKHVNGHMVRYGEYFQQYGDYYKEKLRNCTAKTGEVSNTVEQLSVQDDLLTLLRKGVERLKQSRPDDALSCFDKACRFADDVNNLQYLRAVALMQLGRWQDARQACKAQLVVRPDHRGAENLLGKMSGMLTR